MTWYGTVIHLHETGFMQVNHGPRPCHRVTDASGYYYESRIPKRRTPTPRLVSVSDLVRASGQGVIAIQNWIPNRVALSNLRNPS